MGGRRLVHEGDRTPRSAPVSVADAVPPPEPYPGDVKKASKFREVWERKPDGPVLCALINRDVGWLMYLSEPGDSGWSSRNADYAGPEDAVIEYRLSNGQLDEYPAAWALPLATVERALEHFRNTGERAPFVEWHPD